MNKSKILSARIKKYWRILGPGFINGASDDDPSRIATYSQAGAGFGCRNNAHLQQQKSNKEIYKQKMVKRSRIDNTYTYECCGSCVDLFSVQVETVRILF